MRKNTGWGRAPLLAVAFSPDGRMILAAGYNRVVERWLVERWNRGGESLEPLRHQGQVNAVAFSRDGTLILSGSSDRTARIWDTANGSPAGAPLLHPDEVLAVAFSPDGKTALTGCADGQARLWDITTGRVLAPPLFHTAAVHAVAYSPNRGRVLTGSVDRTAGLWDVPEPMPSEAGAITTWTEVITGLRLDETGNVNVLEVMEWERNRDRIPDRLRAE
jgi:WD40 repeat protein